MTIACRSRLQPFLAQETAHEPAADGPTSKPGTWDDFRVRTVRGLLIGHGHYRFHRETQGKTLNDEQVELVDEMGKVGSEVSLLAQQGDYPRAIDCLETTIAIMFEVFGDDYVAARSLLPTLAGYYESLGDISRASALLQHILADGTDAFTDSPWELDSVRMQHQRLARVMEFNAEEQQTYERYSAAKRQLQADHHTGRYHEAASAARQVRVWRANCLVKTRASMHWR